MAINFGGMGGVGGPSPLRPSVGGVGAPVRPQGNGPKPIMGGGQSPGVGLSTPSSGAPQPAPTAGGMPAQNTNVILNNRWKNPGAGTVAGSGSGDANPMPGVSSGPGMMQAYAKGGNVQKACYAEGGPVLGRARSFVKGDNEFTTGKGVPQDYGSKSGHKPASKSSKDKA